MLHHVTGFSDPALSTQTNDWKNESEQRCDEDDTNTQLSWMGGVGVKAGAEKARAECRET